MRANENVLFDHDRPLMLSAPRPPVKVGKDRGTKTDRAVVSNVNAIGVTVVDVNEMREPDVLADADTSQAVHPWPQTISARANESGNMKETTKQVRKHGITLVASGRRRKDFSSVKTNRW